MNTEGPLTHRIAALSAGFEVRMMARPTKLYLGATEWEELRELAEQNSFRIDRTATGDRRAEYRGMKIYPIDEDNYLGVGE